MSKYGKRHLSIVGFAVGALLVSSSGVAPASAEEATPKESVVAQTANAVAAVDQSSPLDDFVKTGSGHRSTDSSVKIEAGAVALDLGSNTELVLELPVAADAVPEIAADGTLVYMDPLGGLHTEVQSVEDGPARILSIAEESYSDPHCSRVRLRCAAV